MRENVAARRTTLHNSMTVHCPHCATGYLLPDHLVGANGSRVRCPECQGAFVVLPENGRHAVDEDVVSASRPAKEGATAENRAVAADPDSAMAATATAEDPALVAASVLGTLADVLGESLENARTEGRVLSQHGPAILEAFDEYRRRVGDGADPAPFRAALRERCGVDLTSPPAPPRA